MATGNDVLIVGGGIAGLTLALQLERVGIQATVLEAVPSLEPAGVGVNILPHASKELARLGLADELAEISIHTSASVFYNRFGQLIYSDPAGRAAGYPWPQYSIHRGELQMLLARVVRDRLGADRLVLGARAIHVQDRSDHVAVTTLDPSENETKWEGLIAVGCDGVRSAVRSILHPGNEGPQYTGYTMWRGTTRMKGFLDGASMARIGWLETGKLVVYPILNYGDGTQLINWVAELKCPQRADRDWNRKVTDTSFTEPFADWTFDWLDVPSMLAEAPVVFEYPMIDQDQLPYWTKGRVTLMGDAAHPMVPRGSNGAGQAILDTRCLTDALSKASSPEDALLEYERHRLPMTAEVVRLNRLNPPDALLREVYERTADQPFNDVSDVIGIDEIQAILDNYRSATGSALPDLEVQGVEA